MDKNIVQGFSSKKIRKPKTFIESLLFWLFQQGGVFDQITRENSIVWIEHYDKKMGFYYSLNLNRLPIAWSTKEHQIINPYLHLNKDVRFDPIPEGPHELFLSDGKTVNKTETLR